MNAENVARNLLEAFNAHDIEKAFSYLTDDFTASGFGPQLMGKEASRAQMQHQFEAIPDWKINVEKVAVNGNDVTMDVTITGTHTRPFDTGIPGVGMIPPTGRKLSFPDKFTYTVRNDKITGLRFESPANGGPMEMFRQLGVQMSPR